VAVAEKLAARYGVIAEVDYDSSSQPIHHRYDDGVFPTVGRFQCTLCGPELVDAIRNNSVRKVRVIALYSQANCFRDYVDYWHAKKVRYLRSGDAYRLGVCKLILNSLYGKFGAHANRWQQCDWIAASEPYGCHWITLPGYQQPQFVRYIGWQTQLRLPPGENPNAVVSIAAYVTSLGRNRLRLLQNIAGDRSVYYSDTDSIHTDSIGKSRIGQDIVIDRETLGGVKVVGEYHEAEYFGPKWYRIGDKEVIAGISQSAVKLAHGCYEQAENIPFDSELAILPSAETVARRVEIVRRAGGKAAAQIKAGWQTPRQLFE